MSSECQSSRNFALELGFDWNTKPSIHFRAGVFPLQLHTVNTSNGYLVSLSNPSDVRAKDTLCFRIYDFTDYSGWGTQSKPQPLTLQVLFTNGSSSQGVFSPIQDGSGHPLSQVAFTEFNNISANSRSYKASAGWEATSSTGNRCTFESAGRFELRVLLTMAARGEPARFFEVDPEMVVGATGTGS